MTNAYDEIYLDDATETLGSATEYAVLVADLSGEQFIDLFNTSGIAAEFGRGNVKYISGMSGIELCRLVMHKCGLTLPEVTEIEHIDYPAEYWCGWILAYYQWYSGRSFASITKKLTFESLMDMYHVLHEADPSKACTVFDEIMAKPSETNLAIHRKNLGLSQNALAEASDVSVRSIQLYEQRKTDISKAQHNHLQNLARVLGCEIKDLLE